jgi:hypothetical protein
MTLRSASSRIGLLCLLTAFLTSGCMLNIVSVGQTPTTLTAITEAPRRVELLAEIKVPLGTGFPTRLKPNTTWQQVGRIPEGDVFTTADQIVTVEASHIHEAQVVLRGDALVGFYLPVEKTFARTSAPLPLQLKPLP